MTDDAPSNVAPSPPGPYGRNYTVCKYYEGAFPQGVTEDVVCDSPVSGRYLIIQLTETNPLTLCEVEVYDLGEQRNNL